MDFGHCNTAWYMYAPVLNIFADCIVISRTVLDIGRRRPEMISFVGSVYIKFPRKEELQ